MSPIRSCVFVCLLMLAAPVLAQDKGSVAPKPLPPLANPQDPALAAKELFGRSTTPAQLRAQSIGSYARGCVAGATAIPTDGETWQVMRLSRSEEHTSELQSPCNL